MTTIALENKKKIRGVVLSDDIIKELKDTGASHVMTFKDSKGKQYLAHLESRGGEVEVVSDRIYLEHRCPHCGGRVVVTRKGYFCEHCFDKQSPCTFHCNGILSHRFIKPFEVDAYLSGKPVILDGCYNSQGRIFSAVLVENTAFNCSNHEQIGEPFHFSLWRHIRGHAVTLQELQELLEYGITSNEVLLFDDKGSLVKAYLRLSDDRKKIVPEFDLYN